jgi:hypothetical protein
MNNEKWTIALLEKELAEVRGKMTEKLKEITNA